MKAMIFGSAEINDYAFLKKYKSDIIICCDGGINHTYKLGLLPDYILGDFDSADNDIIKYYKQGNIPFKVFPKMKDNTDMDLGVEFAMELKVDEILMVGGIGNRFDHTLANAHLLYKILQNNIKASLVNEYNEIHLINSRITLDGIAGETLSLIPLSSKVSGITTSGLQYPLRDFTLEIGMTRGISNVFLENKISVELTSGYLFVIKTFIA